MLSTAYPGSSATPAGPSPEHRFLLVDADEDSRFLVRWTLNRKFPECTIHTTQMLEPALEVARTSPLTAIIVHRAAGADGASAVRALRAANQGAIIVLMSQMDRRDEAIVAGADYFLPQDEWLRLGLVIQHLLANRPGRLKAAG